ncbi:MAG: hypothetical protein QXV32_06830 [Conexivisphaerales archaeon]
MLNAEPDYPAIKNEYSSNERLRSLMFRQMLKAKRQGVWFRLSRLERSVYTLALNLKVKLQSLELVRAIVGIIKKMKLMGQNLFTIFARGARLAWMFSEAALSWGYEFAASWRNDISYIKYLGISFP